MTSTQLAQLPTFESNIADPYAVQWVNAHARIFRTSGPNSNHRDGEPKFKNIYFLENEQKSESPSNSFDGAQVIPVSFDRAPLRFRGNYDEKNDKLVAEIGLLASPGVYLKLADLNGHPRTQAITAKFDNNPAFYTGNIEVGVLRAQEEPNLPKLSATLNWIGVGTEISGNVIDILKKF